jgi:anhydro-N-acetylmuramic acid kinase
LAREANEGAQQTRVLRAIGLMSGTSLDGIDAALVSTDGERIFDVGPGVSIPYPEDVRAGLRALLGREPDGAARPLIEDFTDRHAAVVSALIAEAGLSAAAVDVVGFHGQTIWHRPERRQTIQIGDAQRLANALGIAVVNDFRSADVAAGGEGAPLVPLYHAALARSLEKPIAVLNIGGVANVTWIGEDGTDPAIVAFDVGPGNALIDDWTRTKTAQPYDVGGRLAAAGRIDSSWVMAWLKHDFFRRPPPKSLDRDDWSFALEAVATLSPEDGAATLAAFTARAVVFSLPLLPAPPVRWLVCGGGRHNPVLMEMLRSGLGAPVEPVESVGWRGDFVEAEAFALLAVRSLRGLPLTLPSTTGVPVPLSGGRLHRPAT